MASHIDPVCGVQVEHQNAAGLSEHKGTTYYFHSEECMSTFNQHPEQYAHRTDEGPAIPAGDGAPGKPH
jgi:Cu+-exporting ATPase